MKINLVHNSERSTSNTSTGARSLPYGEMDGADPKVLKAGKLNVTKRDQGDKVLNTIDPGQCFGESVLLFRLKNASSIIAQ